MYYKMQVVATGGQCHTLVITSHDKNNIHFPTVLSNINYTSNYTYSAFLIGLVQTQWNFHPKSMYKSLSTI